MSIEQFLRQMSEPTEEYYASRKEAIEALQAFQDIKVPEFKIGDIVELNKEAGDRYVLPKDKQAAMVTALIPDKIRDENMVLCDLEITVAHSKGKFRTFLVDSRYYKKAEEKKNVFSIFKGKS